MPRAPYPAIQYHPLEPRHLPQAHALSAALRWPHRLEDWHFALGLGAGEAAWHGDDMAGVALRWNYQGGSTLGQIIVAPAYQGHGIGSALVARALERHDTPGALLHATPEGAGVYARLGFGVVGLLQQHQAVLPDNLPAPAALPPGTALRPLAASDRDWAVDLDAAATGMRRERLIDMLMRQGRGAVLVRGGRAVGYAVVRRWGFGWVIGPVIAPDLPSAQALVHHWLAQYRGEFVRVDTAASSGLGPWLARHGLPRVDYSTIMAHGPQPMKDSRYRAYALVSQAMG
ncbi:GNAT family N-acetyltransferase [Bordetella petrii]|uniref:GNAT family N-acetyltransferase n=1 Tax=Bordetella petrii TaxID=94624 RepID=UPI001E299129|nr:GNAT family N-acetyltransferase [Bordetella petrii]MCD0504598.1 GNAT family N-acetyltransferase [Bordetella petrii]